MNRKPFTVTLTITPTPDADRRRQYSPRKRSRSNPESGVIEWWRNIFVSNEERPKNEKMTDEKIVDVMLREFKGVPTIEALREPRYIQDPKTGIYKPNPKHRSVNQHRNMYNAGRYNGPGPTLNKPPPIHSFRYNESGEQVNPRTGLPFRKPNPKLPSGKKFSP